MQCHSHVGKCGCSHQACGGDNGPWDHTPWTYVSALWDVWPRLGPGKACRRGERDEAEPRQKPTVRHRKDHDGLQVPTPTPPRDGAAVSAFESPTVFPVILLIYSLWLNPIPVNFSSWWPNNSSLRQMGKISVIWKTIQLSKRINSPKNWRRLQMAVNFCILCSLPKCFLFNMSVSIKYPSLD